MEAFKARGSYLVKFIAPLVKDIPVLRPRDIMNRVRSEVEPRRHIWLLGEVKPLLKKRGVEEINQSYQRIKSLLHNLLMENPGSITAFEVDVEDRFTRAFVLITGKPGCLWKTY